MASEACAGAVACGIAEIRELIAIALVEVSYSPVNALTDLKNLRLTEKAWNRTITVSPTVQHMTYSIPLPVWHLRTLINTAVPRSPTPKEFLEISEHYSTTSKSNLIHASDVTFNQVLSRLFLRFSKALLNPKNPRVNGTVKLSFGEGKSSRSFWMSYSNHQTEPRLHPYDDYSIEISTWKAFRRKGFGREVCEQYISQPPISQITLTLRVETNVFLFRRRKAKVNVTENGGIKIWHILAKLLDALNHEGSNEIHDLFGRPHVGDIKEATVEWETDDEDDY